MTGGDKQKARAAARARRRAVDPALGPVACGNLVSLLRERPPAILAGYAAIRDELDPAPALDALVALGWTIALPRVRAADLPLEFLRWEPGDPLEEGRDGIPVPVADRPLTPDIVITPLLAFDGRRYRLGYGGGFYDRTLARLRATGGVEAIGIAYARQEAASLPTDPHDEPLDAIVTEDGVLAPRGAAR
ncbi:MAG: 5-formyltetrahydrofolate cyclo-ligase [Rubricella sp.]